MNKLKTCQKLALAAVTMLSLSLDETACPRSITESTHWRATPLTRKLLIDVLHCLPLNKSKRLLLTLNLWYLKSDGENFEKHHKNCSGPIVY